MQANRRKFLEAAGILTIGSVLPRISTAVGAASQVLISQLVYPGGNWRPRSTALRRLAWEVHKRTAVNAALEPTEVKLTGKALSSSPLLYLSGDRQFPEWSERAHATLARFVKLGGTLIIDPAYTPEGDEKGFEKSADAVMQTIMPDVEQREIPPGHVLYRSFYQVERPVGRIEGPAALTGYSIGDRLSVIRTRHDLGGAWARDNLGNWEHPVSPGGERQRENAFRLGVNMVLYALCGDYKNEESHLRFGRSVVGD